jgi:hypothetical protein
MQVQNLPRITLLGMESLGTQIPKSRGWLLVWLGEMSLHHIRRQTHVQNNAAKDSTVPLTRVRVKDSPRRSGQPIEGTPNGPKIESDGAICLPYGFIASNLEPPPSPAVMRVCNKRGTAEQWIKDGKLAVN